MIVITTTRRRARRDRAIVRAALAWWDFDGSLGTGDETIEFDHILGPGLDYELDHDVPSQSP